MSKLALILFLLIIIAYIISYLRFNFQHFQVSSISDDQLSLALYFFDALKLENNVFTINDKPIISQIKGTFRLGMWKLEDNVNSITTYLNFLSNGKVHSFDTKEATDTYEVSPNATNLDCNYGGQSYNFEYVNEDKYKIVGSNNIHLTKLKDFTIKTLCSARQGNGCTNLGNEKSLFYLNDIQYKIKYTNEKTQTSYDDYGAESGLEELYGMHILVLNSNGSIYDFKHYDLFTNAEHYLEAKEFIKDIPSGKIVAVNTYGDIARIGYPRIELYDTNNTMKLSYRLISYGKHIDLTNPTGDWTSQTDVFVEGASQPISKIKMSPGIKFTLYANKTPDDGNPGTTLESDDYQAESSNITGTESDTKYKLINLSGAQQKTYKSIRVSYDLNDNDDNIMMKSLRNPIEAMMKIGGKYGIRLNPLSTYSIIGVKDEPMNNAIESIKTPYEETDCPEGFKNTFIAINQGFDSSVSRNFILTAYKPKESTIKVDAFSKGLHYYEGNYDSHGFSAFYVNDKYIDLDYVPRGINILVLNEDGTPYDFKGFDTYDVSSIVNSVLEELLTFYEGVPQGKIVCLSFVDASISGAVQKGYLTDSSEYSFGQVIYVSQGPYANNGIYKEIYTQGYKIPGPRNIEIYGEVAKDYKTKHVFITNRAKLELYSGSNLDGTKTTVTHSQMIGGKYTFPTEQTFDSVKVVPDYDNNDIVDIYDIIKDIGGPDDIGLNSRCNFAIIGKKGAPPKSAIYQNHNAVEITVVYGTKDTSSPINSLAHASKSFDLVN